VADLVTYAGQQPNWTREGPIYPVDIAQAESGHEVRTVWGPSRYRYRGEIILQGLSSQVAAVVTLINGAHEKGHTFTIVDPVDPTGRAAIPVRLESPLSITPYQGMRGTGGTTGWFTAKFTAITVVTVVAAPV
jgi:hypothetical protein